MIFLRAQVLRDLDRGNQPGRIDNLTRFVLATTARFFDWKSSLFLVKPRTLIAWRRQGLRLLWRRKSRPRGRPSVPRELRELIAQMAKKNASWGEERIASELRLKLGIRISPRTVGKYMPRHGRPQPGQQCADQRWRTFLHNHARAIVACDFFTSTTLGFRILYVLVFLELGSRRIVHFNLTEHPTQAWTHQQMREVFDGETSYRFLIHDRDEKFSPTADEIVRAVGVKVIQTPRWTPVANSYAERLIGTLRRECLDFLIPFSEAHLRRILKEWTAHYNRGRPHSRLGPGFPQVSPGLPVAAQPRRHHLPPRTRVVSRPVLGGLHHEYRLEKIAA